MAGRSKFARLYRVIIRFSFDSDTNSAVRNEIERQLVAVGISNRRTGTWESDAFSLKKASDVFEQLFRVLARPSLVTGSDKSFRLDHIWIYLDADAV
jgi:type IV pilus biogenesis protein CpaD/CtpE